MKDNLTILVGKPRVGGEHHSSAPKLLQSVGSQLIRRLLLCPRIVNRVVQVRHINRALITAQLPTQDLNGVVNVVKLSVSEPLRIVLGPTPSPVRVVCHELLSKPLKIARRR